MSMMSMAPPPPPPSTTRPAGGPSHRVGIADNASGGSSNLNPVHDRTTAPHPALHPPQGGLRQSAPSSALAPSDRRLTAANISSERRREALAQVPCKFFRSNGCSAGAACAFSHTLPDDPSKPNADGVGSGTNVICQWFLRGNCRFGAKCALAHIYPGQSVGEDRRFKRSSQVGLSASSPTVGLAPTGGASALPRQVPPQRPHQNHHLPIQPQHALPLPCPPSVPSRPLANFNGVTTSSPTGPRMQNAPYRPFPRSIPNTDAWSHSFSATNPAPLRSPWETNQDQQRLHRANTARPWGASSPIASAVEPDPFAGTSQIPSLGHTQFAPLNDDRIGAGTSMPRDIVSQMGSLNLNLAIDADVSTNPREDHFFPEPWDPTPNNPYPLTPLGSSLGQGSSDALRLNLGAADLPRTSQVPYTDALAPSATEPGSLSDRSVSHETRFPDTPADLGRSFGSASHTLSGIPSLTNDDGWLPPGSSLGTSLSGGRNMLSTSFGYHSLYSGHSGSQLGPSSHLDLLGTSAVGSTLGSTLGSQGWSGKPLFEPSETDCASLDQDVSLASHSLRPSSLVTSTTPASLWSNQGPRAAGENKGSSSNVLEAPSDSSSSPLANAKKREEEHPPGSLPPLVAPVGWGLNSAPSAQDSATIRRSNDPWTTFSISSPLTSPSHRSLPSWPQGQNQGRTQSQSRKIPSPHEEGAEESSESDHTSAWPPSNKAVGSSSARFGSGNIGFGDQFAPSFSSLLGPLLYPHPTTTNQSTTPPSHAEPLHLNGYSTTPKEQEAAQHHQTVKPSLPAWGSSRASKSSTVPSNSISPSAGPFSPSGPIVSALTATRSRFMPVTEESQAPAPLPKGTADDEGIFSFE